VNDRANKIPTSHAGSLPRPADLLTMNRAKQQGEPVDEAARLRRVASAVADVVRHQVDVGIDIVNDGELGRFNFLAYAPERLTGFEPDPSGRSDRFNRRDYQRFEDFYRELHGNRQPWIQAVCTGPIRYVGQAQLRTDLENLKAALAGVQAQDAFMTAIAASSFGRGHNHYYRTEEEYLDALSQALKEEYTAIVEAGFILQIDDPGLPARWDAVAPAMSLEEYRGYAGVGIEALNSALQHLPEDRVRYHICWGSWHGPHTTDIELRDIVDIMLRVHAGTFSVEAGNVRHEMDWKVWQDVRLPAGKKLMPGVVSHATNVVEHPELVADRLMRYARLVGRDNVIAGTDCGLGNRVHPQIAWAKLQVLSEGAALASRQLWA
jgi:5-methyltetrahydropteroyltriglutamate--homocysteine methyltransferase